MEAPDWRRARLYTLVALVEMAGYPFRGGIVNRKLPPGATISPAGFGPGPNPRPAGFAPIPEHAGRTEQPAGRSRPHGRNNQPPARIRGRANARDLRRSW